MGLNLMAGSIAMRYCERLDRCGGLRLAQPISATATSLFLSRAIHCSREVIGAVCALHPVAVTVYIALPARLRKKPCRISKGRPFLITSSLRNQFVGTTWGSCLGGGPGRWHNTLCVPLGVRPERPSATNLRSWNVMSASASNKCDHQRDWRDCNLFVVGFRHFTANPSRSE